MTDLSGGFVNPNMNNINPALKSVANDISGDIGKAVSNRVREEISKIPDMISNPVASTVADIAINAALNAAAGGASTIEVEGGGGSNSPNLPGGGQNVTFDPSTMNYQPDPVDIKFSTNIVPNCYGDWFYDSTDEFSCLNLSNCYLKIESANANSPVYNYFNRVVYPTMLTALQQAISFSIPTFFTAEALIAYYDNVLYALQIYYQYDSILAYFTNPENRNDGVTFLKDNITAEAFNQLNELKRALNGYAIPPNLINFVWFFSQFYTASDNRGCTLNKFIPGSMSTSASKIFPNNTEINAAISRLRDSEQTSSIIARACPKWLYQDLPGSSTVPLHSEGWLTVWSNSPTSFQSATVTTAVKMPNVVGVDTDFVYASFTNTLDGALYALTGVYVDNVLSPSLIFPRLTTSGGTTFNRFRYVSPAVGFAFTPGNPTNYSSGFTNHITDAGNAVSFVPFGAAAVRGVCYNSIFQSVMQTVDFMSSRESIGRQKDNRDYNSRTGSTSNFKVRNNSRRNRGR